MALTDMVIMPGDDYQAVCNELRALDGSTDLIRSAQMSGKVKEANNEISDQTRLLTLLENVLAEKAAGGGGIDMDSFRNAWVYGGDFSAYWSPIAFPEGMTWAEFIESPLNAGILEEAGPATRYNPMLRAYNGRVCSCVGHNPPMYLARNSEGYEWRYSKSPQSGDVVVSTDDLIVDGENYWFRQSDDWNP